MRELDSAADLAAACGDDALCGWAAQGLPGPGSASRQQPGAGRAWAAAAGDAVLVACPGLSKRDRAVVWGEPEPAARLAAEVLPLLGPSYRLLGHGDLIGELPRWLPGLTVSPPFGWMNTEPGQRLAGADGAAGADGGAGAWLGPGDMAEVTALLKRDFPDSYAWPGMTGVRRWAGIRDGEGRLAAVAADAWSAPTVGFMAGVAVRAESRDAGLGSRLCRFVAAELIARHGRAALMVDAWNDAAIRMYRRLGMVFRPIRAAGTDPARG
jgi:GNAT superfamily N-acetyltransferase